MGGLVKGDVVVLPFPFSDLSQAKRRPALVLASFPSGDAILCQITSQGVKDEHAVALDDTAFAEGGLPKASNVRPNKLFTAHESLILYRAGRLAPPSTTRVTDTIVRILRDTPEGTAAAADAP